MGQIDRRICQDYQQYDNVVRVHKVYILLLLTFEMINQLIIYYNKKQFNFQNIPLAPAP